MKSQRFARAILAWIILAFAFPLVVKAQGRRGSEESRLLRDAAALESRGDYERAEMVLRRLLDIDPSSTGGVFALERVFRAQGKPEKILPVVDVFLDTNSSASGVRYVKLRVLADLDSLEALEVEAALWFESDPGSEEPYREVARVYEDVFGVDRAIETLRIGREATGRDDALALEMGDLLAVTGAVDSAVEEWATAVGEDGSQAAGIVRRIKELEDGKENAGHQLVDHLATSGVVARQRAGARIALDLGLENTALDLSRRVASDLEGRTREIFLSEVARRAREGGLSLVASWAYEQLGQGASTPSERRQFDQRIIDVALAAGDTTAALEAQRRVANSFSLESIDRRRATAQVIRLESARANPSRLTQLLQTFRDEFPNAPELDDLAATVAKGLQVRGDLVGAAAVLDGIEGPQSGLERAYLMLDMGEIAEGRGALLNVIEGLQPTEATDVIQFVGLLGRLSEEAADVLARAGVLAHRGIVNEAVNILVDGTDELEGKEHPPLLAEAARIADRGKAFEQGASIRTRLISEYPEAPELGDAALALARYRARTPDGIEQAIAILEELITTRPNAAVVPDARVELEKLKGG
mgnify:FL=1